MIISVMIMGKKKCVYVYGGKLPIGVFICGCVGEWCVVCGWVQWGCVCMCETIAYALPSLLKVASFFNLVVIFAL